MQYVFWAGFAFLFWIALGSEGTAKSNDVEGLKLEFEALTLRAVKGIMYAIMAFCCLYAAMHWGK